MIFNVIGVFDNKTRFNAPSSKWGTDIYEKITTIDCKNLKTSIRSVKSEKRKESSIISKLKFILKKLF
ncbi:hypothetical protein COJ46_02520 [Bacillus sp. AFS077874]|nr:hypothetical protein COJ46_02520 [Bacillus sp. AFS077874]